MAKNANPFAEYDFTKVWGDLKVPTFDIEAVMAAQKRNLDAVSAANKAAMEGFQTVAHRQAELARETMANTAEATQAYTKLTSPEDKLAYQAKYAKTAFETGLDTMREMTGIFGQATAQAVDVMTKRVVESFDEVEGLVANGTRAAKAETAPKAASK